MFLIEPLAGLILPSTRWWFRSSRASGPGGQHVNKTESRVELVFDIAGCPELSATQRSRITSALATRCNAQGELRLVTGAERSQQRNKEVLVQRLEDLLAGALKPRRRRKKTKPTAASKGRRIEVKKRRSEIKKSRRPPSTD